nr:Protein SSH4 [Ipomoea batatas]GME17268.1 Protein SSH4 [Ipomoea batatas]
MEEWLKITLAAVSTGVLVSLVILVVRKVLCRRRGRVEERRSEIMEDGPAGRSVSQLHHVSLHHLDRNGTKKTNYYVFRRGPSAKAVFSWADHPSLVTDAVENGWTQFGFAAYTPSPSVKSARSLLGACGTGDHGNQTAAAKITWEVSPGSADFMQKIQFRCNSDVLKRITSTRHNFTAMGSPVSSVIKTCLPLPGPPLGASPFPQEAYFEITVLPCDDQEESRRSQDDKIKLIPDDINAKTPRNPSGDGKENRNHVALSVGLSGCGSLPLKLPGSYPGSIGFNSNGSVCLDGMMLVNESEREEWGTAEKVIGCGYNPTQKKVFFTVDSQLIHEIHCKSEEFGNPLYPTLAANADITVVVNLGQSAFKYAPANLQRTPNPCFIGPLASNSPAAIGYEDSKELFSMGRIDSQWLNRSATAARSNGHSVNNLKQIDFDLESEGELFEIVLDSSGKNPNTL